MDAAHAVVCVPLIVAVRPGQDAGEGCKQVVEGPCQDDVVVTVQQEDNHCSGKSYTCK